MWRLICIKGPCLLLCLEQVQNHAMQGRHGSDTPLAHAGPHMIAMNLYNNAYLMPRIIHQMLSLLATLPHGTAFLSIYESNSGGSTGAPTRGPCQ